MTKKINTAVIGVGYLGRFHAQKYAQLSNSNLVGLIDYDFSRAQAVAEECQTQAYQSCEEVIDLVDAVSIVTPTPFHYETAKFFLSHGKHVLVEKPITTQIAQARELIDLAKQNSVLLQVGHLERFNTVLTAAESFIKKPWFIEATRLAPFKIRGSDVSVILDLMIHDLDLIFSIVKSKLKKIEACGSSLITSLTDIAKVRLEFENGCCAHLTASRVSQKTERRLQIFQAETILNLDFDQKQLEICRRTNSETIQLEKGDALLAEIEAFLTAITNQKPALVSGEDGAFALDAALKIEALIS